MLDDAQIDFGALFENDLDACAILDQDQVVLRVNRAFVRLFGYEAGDAIGRSINDLIVPTHRLAEVESIVQRARAMGGLAFDTIRRRRDGSLVPVWVVAQRHVVKGGTIVYVQYREPGSRTMEAVGRLAGGVAHEFNNVLTVLQGHASMLLEEPLSARAHEDVQEILSAANRATGLTRQLLAYSRQQVLKPTRLDLNALVRDQEHIVQRMIREDIDLELALKEGVPPIRADRTQVEQVVLSLAVNARDAMPDGGQIRIETDRFEPGQPVRIRELTLPAGLYGVLSVADSGRGMSDDELARIFEPFFSTHEQGKGSGLGLATVYGIVKQSGAYIGVDSRKAGGTTFTIYFPVKEG